MKTDPRVRWTDVKACAAVDLRADLGKIKKPTLVLAGADDAMTTPADAQFIADHIPGAKIGEDRRRGAQSADRKAGGSQR